MAFVPTTRVSLLLLGALAAACAREAGPPEIDATSRRRLPAGEVVGFTGQYGSHAWRGIPFAEPPLGPLRWRAPRPAPPWEGTREALAPGRPCSQFASVYAGSTRDVSGVMGGEDCLTLDVWAPRLAREAIPSGAARLPVMLWIHGGGQTIGSSGFYDGGHLAASQDVVVVAIQYRLGPFGWFRHSSLRGEGTTAADRSGNFGTLDAIRALEWVQENIAAFGGDPDRVTIFGESAGGANVLSLLLSPLAQGLFHRAIAQSPGFGFATVAEAESFAGAAEPERDRGSNEILTRLMIADGSAADAPASRARLEGMDDAAVEAYLRSKDAEQILTTYTTRESQGMYGLPTLFREGSVLPHEDPRTRIERGAYNQVPFLVGTNRDENKVFMAFDPELSEWRWGIFPTPHDQDAYDARAEHQANAWKARSVDSLASAMRRAQGPSVYAYRWDWDEELGVPLVYDGSRVIGAAHGLEIAFVFGHWDLGPESRLLFGWWNSEGREALSAQMMSYWAQFAYEGAPGRGRGDDLPEWPAWDDSSPGAARYAILDTPAGGGFQLSSETQSMEKVMAAIAADSRLDNVRDKCGVLWTLADWRYLEKEQYASANGALCAQLAFEDYPWPDVAAGTAE